jgi:uncharacterized cupredoxin-like copper-binding protein
MRSRAQFTGIARRRTHTPPARRPQPGKSSLNTSRTKHHPLLRRRHPVAAIRAIARPSTRSGITMPALRPLLLAAALLPLPTPPATAAGDLGRQEPVVVTLQLGDSGGAHRFTPDALTLETGKLYALRLHNAGSQPYYFRSNALADAVYTRKVVARDAAGNMVAEVYGAVRRVEIAAGQVAEWWFVPIRTGRFDDVISTPALRDAGMRATIEVK